MLAAIALSPQAPVLLPALAGSAAAEVAGIRTAAVAAAAALPQHWIAIGVGPAEQFIGPENRGTFAGYGADVPVALSPDAAAEPVALPLCALFAGWLHGQANPAAHVQVRVYPADLDSAGAQARGRALRAQIDVAAEPVGVLVLADGANTLIPSAPGGYDPTAQGLQCQLDRALAAGNAEALSGLPDRIVGRVAYQVLAGLAPHPTAATELASGAPFGVGYFVGTWLP